MDSIFPPSGPQDKSRLLRIDNDLEREYLWFCLEFCGRVLGIRPAHPEALKLAANHLTCLGYFADGLRLDQCLAALRPDDPYVIYNLSCSLALTGQPDAALRQLAKAVEIGYRDYHHMLTDPDLASLRADTRFHELMALTVRLAAGAGEFQPQSEKLESL